MGVAFLTVSCPPSPSPSTVASAYLLHLSTLAPTLDSWSHARSPTSRRSASGSCMPVSAAHRTPPSISAGHVTHHVIRVPTSPGHVMRHVMISPGHVIRHVMTSPGHVTHHVTVLPSSAGHVTYCVSMALIILGHVTLRVTMVTVEGGVSIAVGRTVVGVAYGPHPRRECVKSN